MSNWKFDGIDFATYGVKVRRSSGILNMAKIANEGYDWLDQHGKEYWQTTADLKWSDREIVLDCFIKAKEGIETSAYEEVVSAINGFYAVLMAEGTHILGTPYGNVSNVFLQNEVSVESKYQYVKSEQIGLFSLRFTVTGTAQLQYFSIIAAAGTSVKAIIGTNNMQVTRTLQGESSASCSFEVNEPIVVDMYDYVLINTNGVTDEPYYLFQLPEVRKVSSNKFVYNLKLEHGSSLLKNSQFLSPDGTSDFYLYGNLEDIIDLVVTNSQRFISDKFLKGTIDETENRNHKFSGENCYDVVKRMAQEYGLEYDIRFGISGPKYTINIVKQIAETKEITLEYGKGNELYELTRQPINRDDLCTVMYAYGAAKNLKPDYRGGGKFRLEFDGNPLRQNDNLYMGVEKAVFFDDIFPQRSATVTAYAQILKCEEGDPGWAAYAEIKEVWPGGLFKVTDSSIDFDLNDYLLGGLAAKLRMKTGDLAGYEFEIEKYDHEEKAMFIIPFKDERGEQFPNADLLIAAADEYTLIDIDQPESYVEEAEEALYDAAVAWLDEHSTPQYPYSCVVQPKYLRTLATKFEVGDRVTVVDDDFDIEQLYRISSITVKLYQGTYEFTLSEHRIYTTRERLNLRLNSVERQIKDTKKDTVESMRKEKETATELRNRIFDPADDFQALDRTVRNESIDPRMLGYDAGVPMWLVKGVIIEPSYEGDENKLRITNGEIFITNDPSKTKNRYDISKDRAAYDPNRVWSIESYEFDLDTGHEYFLYARLPLEDGVTVGTLELSETFFQVKRYIEDGYICYPVAFINTAASPRVVSALWGNVRQVNAASINAMIDPRLLTGGRPLYLHQQDSDITDFKKLLFDEPDEAFQEYDCFTDFYEGEKLLKEFSTDAGFTNVIRSGAWVFSIWAKASNNDDSSDLLVYVLKRDGNGLETELFNVEIPVSAIVPTCYQKVMMHTQVGITATDRIVVRFKQRCISSFGKTLYIYCEGDTDGEWWWSNVRIPVDVQFGGVDTDELVKYDENDQTSGYLTAKLDGVDEEEVNDDDTFNFVTAVGTVLKKISWSNIKTTLKTYFDNVYSAIGHTHSFTDNDNYVDDATFDANTRILTLKRTGTLEDIEVEIPGVAVFEIPFEFCVIAGTIQTFKIDRSSSFAYTIAKVKLESDGTLEGVQVKIGSTAVTGLNDMDISTMQSFTATAANVVAENDVVSIVTTATYSGTPTYLAGKIIFEV